ncbi:hypothetical protein [Nocardia brasiliensis]|uniref:hypothetical protein n=1 Tax=Nocardia brasiliensis TaxID=37326 RepID=UPI003D8BF6EB
MFVLAQRVGVGVVEALWVGVVRAGGVPARCVVDGRGGDAGREHRCGTEESDHQGERGGTSEGLPVTGGPLGESLHGVVASLLIY